jgi:hypothetical protein
MKLTNLWSAFQRRSNSDQPPVTLAASGEPAERSKSKPYVYLPAGTDYRKLAIALIEQCGYVVVSGDMKRGGQSGTRQKSRETNVSPLPAGVKLETGARLRRRVEILRVENPKLTINAALRQILETAVTGPLKDQRASKTRINAVVEGNLPGLISRYHAKKRPTLGK